MQLLRNNASSTLAAAAAAAALTVQLAPGDGARFPNPQNGDDFLVTLFQRVGATEQNWEIVLCTARAGDVLTIVRAQEGTIAFPFNPGDFVEMRLTAGAVLPVRSGALTGPLNEAAIVPMASGSSMAIGIAGGNTIVVSGSAAINTFDSVGSGAIRRMKFATGGAVVTHNAAALRCVAGGSIITEHGDWCEWLSLGAGVWEMTYYSRASGNPLTNPAPSTGRLFYMKG